MEVLREFDEEYGISNLPDGVYHMKVAPTLGMTEGKNGKQVVLRVPLSVICGEHTGRETSDFPRWFRTNKDGTPNPKGTAAARSSVTQLLTALTAIAPTTARQAGPAIITLRRAASDTEATKAIQEALTPFIGQDFYVRLVTKGDFQNARYLDKKEPIHADCACVTAAVRV